jgi:hypothetical protein
MGIALLFFFFTDSIWVICEFKLVLAKWKATTSDEQIQSNGLFNKILFKLIIILNTVTLFLILSEIIML